MTACKIFKMMNVMMAFRKITTRTQVNYEIVPHNTCQALGFFSDSMNFNVDNCKVLIKLQSSAILQEDNFTKIIEVRATCLAKSLRRLPIFSPIDPVPDDTT
jgi:S-adenosylmethionine synthetase